MPLVKLLNLDDSGQVFYEDRLQPNNLETNCLPLHFLYEKSQIFPPKNQIFLVISTLSCGVSRIYSANL